MIEKNFFLTVGQNNFDNKIPFFQQKFVLQGGSVLNELPEVPDTNLLPFDKNLDGGQQFDVEKIVVHPKFNPFFNLILYIFSSKSLCYEVAQFLNELPEVPGTNLLPFVVHLKFNPFSIFFYIFFSSKSLCYKVAQC